MRRFDPARYKLIFTNKLYQFTTKLINFHNVILFNKFSWADSIKKVAISFWLLNTIIINYNSLSNSNKLIIKRLTIKSSIKLEQF